MTIQLLPADFDLQIEQAVRIFWKTRSGGKGTQGGTRGRVVSGKNLDGFLDVVTSIATHCGVPKEAVFTKGRADLTLPGYYRPTKNWDVVIIHKTRLLAVLEFKSQVGSFGNNFNNRTEEVIGNASDLWVAAKQGTYLPSNHWSSMPEHDTEDPRQPFLGYLMLLEDCDGSTQPVKLTSPHYKIAPEFHETSYSDRYRILCERLMSQNLYRAAALMMSDSVEGQTSGRHRHLTEPTSGTNLFRELAAHLLAAVQS